MPILSVRGRSWTLGRQPLLGGKGRDGRSCSGAGLTLAVPGLASWFWLDPAPQVHTVQLPDGYRVTQAPASVTWTFDDGATLDLPMPAAAGTAHPQASTVQHTHERFSTAGYAVGATVSWDVSWTLTTGPSTRGPYALGTVRSPAAVVRYPVEQAQAVLNGAV